jgi:hypothetical protein
MDVSMLQNILHLRGLAYIVKIDPTGAGCGEWISYPLELYGTGVRTPGSIPIVDADWTITTLPTPKRNAFDITVKFSCSLGTF